MSKSTKTLVLFPRALGSFAMRVFVVLAILAFSTSVYSISRGPVQPAYAAAPTTLNFQGRLMSSAGNLVPDGNYNIEFKLYNAASSTGSSQGSCAGDAACLWVETRTGGNQVQVKNGYFSAYLGDVSALPTNIWDQQLWLTMNIGGTGLAVWDGEMTPRIRLTSVPYAFRATVAERAETLSKTVGGFTGLVDFSNLTANRTFLFPDTSLATSGSPGTICVYNGTASNCPAAQGSSYYIQNDVVKQSETNFYIQGRNDGTAGTVVGVLQGAENGQTVDLLQFKASNGTTLAAVTAAGNMQVAGSLDVYAANALTIGGTNATSITVGRSGITTTIAGAITVDESATFSGAVTVANTMTFTGSGVSITTGTDGDLTIDANGTGRVIINDDVEVGGALSTKAGSVYTTPGTSNNAPLNTASLYTLDTSGAAQVINGITAGRDGQMLTLVNSDTTNQVTIGNDSVSATGAKIITGTGGNIVIPVGGSISLIYDSANTVWRVVGGAALVGGAANQQLSNLGSTAINANLNPDTANTYDLGSSSYSWRTLYAGTSVLTPVVDTVDATTLSIGTTNANAVSISRTGVTTTVNGALTVSEALSANAGISASGGAVSLTGNAASSLTTSAGALTITSADAATWSTTTGNLTIQAGSGTITLGTTTALTAAGQLSVTSGGANTLSLDAGGAAALNLGTTNANAVSISRTGVLTTVAGGLQVNEGAEFRGGLMVTNGGNVSFQNGSTSDVTTTGTLNDLALGTGVLFRLNGASAQTITSIAGGTDGRIITLINAGTNAATIQNDAGGTAANRIITGTGADLVLPAGATVQLAYDSDSSRWRVIGGTATQGGAANQQLSNLSGTVAVNQSLVPRSDLDNMIDLGSSSYGWRSVYADTSVFTPLVGRATSGTLEIGTDANSTALTISRTGVLTTVAGGLQVNEGAEFRGGLMVTNGGNFAVQRNATNYTATGTQDNVNFGTGALFRIASASAVTINGIAGGSDGRLITLMNASVNIVTLGNSASGTAANNIITGTGDALQIPAGSSVQLAYDSSSNVWRVIGGTATQGGAANQQLSNLSGTVAVNQSLVPRSDLDNLIDLGSPSYGWRTVYADTSVLTALLDTQSASALNIGTTNATQINLDKNTRVTGNVTFAGGANRELRVEARATAGAGYNLTVAAGAANGSGNAGGALYLQGGAAVAGNANGGAVYIAGGAGSGTGTQGLVNLSTTAFSSAAVQSYGAGSSTISQALVDNYSTIPVIATNTSAVISVPDPGQTAAIGRVLYIAARAGSTDFTLRLNAADTPIDIAMKQNSTATLIWNGTDWTAAGASSSTDLQSAYNNTLTSAGGAEIVLNPVGGNADGFTIRNNGTTPIIGGLLEVQSSIGSNLFSINNNAIEYAINGGAETAGGSANTFPASTWDATTGGTVDRWTTAGDYIATGQASVRIQSTATNHGARNRLSAPLTSGMTYSVSFAARASTNFSTLQVLYSPDGSTSGTATCTTGTTVTQGSWTRVLCTFVAAGSINANNSILIRQTDGATRTYYIDNLSVSVNANMTFAGDGSVDNAGTFGTNWSTFNGGSVSRTTSEIFDTTGAAAATTGAANRGIRNNMPVTPAVNTQYLVTFYAKATSAMSGTLRVGFLPTGGNSVPATNQQCVDYSSQSLVTSSWTRITCIITTPGSGISDPDLVIYQTDASARTIYVDALTINLNTNNSNNVQIGGSNKGGPTTLFTLDRASSPPIAANNDAYLGSMYYDTTTGRIQCYEADGWGACGSSPDNIISLTPEYTGAVLGTPGSVMGGGSVSAGVGVLTADFCSNQPGVLVTPASGNICASGEARNFYRWTSPQPSEQVYSIYVNYNLPSTFKAFNDSNTITLTALTDSLSNASATLQVFRKSPSGVTSCGAATVINTVINSWETTPFGGDETTCGFQGGDNIIFKIDVKSRSNGNVFVENLNFVFTNN